MRLRKGQFTTGFSARVSKTDVAEFNRILVQYGSKVWFIKTALSRLLETLDDRPELVEEINSRIDYMLSANTDEALGGVEFQTRISCEDSERFNRYFPQYGATTWFIRSVIQSFIAQSHTVPTPTSQIQSAVDNMLAPQTV